MLDVSSSAEAGSESKKRQKWLGIAIETWGTAPITISRLFHQEAFSLSKELYVSTRNINIRREEIMYKYEWQVTCLMEIAFEADGSIGCI